MPKDAARLGALAGALVRMHHQLDSERFMSGEGIDDGYGRWLIKESGRGALVLPEVGPKQSGGETRGMPSRGVPHDLHLRASASVVKNTATKNQGRALVLVAEDDAGDVQGYVYATVEPRDWVDLIEAHGKLHDVYVDEGARRAGVARALVLAALEALRAAGAPRVILSTASKNAAAQAFFRSLGFAPTMIEMMRGS